MDPCCVTLGRRGQGQTFDAPSDTHLGHRQHLYSRTNVLRPTWCASRSAPRSRSAHRPRPTCRNRRGARSIERPGHWGDSEGVEPVDCGVTDHRVAVSLRPPWRLPGWLTAPALRARESALPNFRHERRCHVHSVLKVLRCVAIPPCRRKHGAPRNMESRTDTSMSVATELPVADTSQRRDWLAYKLFAESTATGAGIADRQRGLLVGGSPSAGPSVFPGPVVPPKRDSVRYIGCGRRRCTASTSHHG